MNVLLPTNLLRCRLTDAELMCAAREQDSEAWKILCERYLPLVWRYAYTQVEHCEQAEDITSETMLAFLKNMHQIDIETPRLSAWLRSVVRHKVADHRRQVYRIKDRMRTIYAEGSPPVERALPSMALELAETREQVLQVLDRLPELHRLLLEWKYAEGMRVREMALRLDKTEKGIEALLYRARQEFRRQYGLVERGVLASSSTESLGAEQSQA